MNDSPKSPNAESSGVEMDEVTFKPQYSNMQKEPIEQKDDGSDDSDLLTVEESKKYVEYTVVSTIIACFGAKIIVILIIVCFCVFICVIAGILAAVLYVALENSSDECLSKGKFIYSTCMDAESLNTQEPNVLKRVSIGYSKLECLEKIENSEIRNSFGMTNSTYCYKLEHNILRTEYNDFRVNTTYCSETSCKNIPQILKNDYDPPIDSEGSNKCGSSSTKYMSIFVFEETVCQYSS